MPGICMASFGELSPSGKLSETFPIRLEHNPTHETFPGDKQTVRYSEGIFSGYRYYDTKAWPVQYPFGHGLGYTRFELADMVYDSVGRRVSATLRNTGERARAGVVRPKMHSKVAI